jgi:hypothetical protein
LSEYDALENGKIEKSDEQERRSDMSMMMVLSVMVFFIAVVGLIYTYVVARNQKYLQSELDTKLNERVQAHPYIRNPVFVAWALFLLAILAIVGYLTALYY